MYINDTISKTVASKPDKWRLIFIKIHAKLSFSPERSTILIRAVVLHFQIIHITEDSLFLSEDVFIVNTGNELCVGYNYWSPTVLVLEHSASCKRIVWLWWTLEKLRFLHRKQSVQGCRYKRSENTVSCFLHWCWGISNWRWLWNVHSKILWASFVFGKY